MVRSKRFIALFKALKSLLKTNSKEISQSFQMSKLGCFLLKKQDILPTNCNQASDKKNALSQIIFCFVFPIYYSAITGNTTFSTSTRLRILISPTYSLPSSS